MPEKRNRFSGKIMRLPEKRLRISGNFFCQDAENAFARKTVPYFGQFFFLREPKTHLPEKRYRISGKFFCQENENTFARKTVPFFGQNYAFARKTAPHFRQIFLPGNRKHICPKNGTVFRAKLCVCPKNGTVFRANFFARKPKTHLPEKRCRISGKFFLSGNRKHICPKNGAAFRANFFARRPKTNLPEKRYRFSGKIMRLPEKRHRISGKFFCQETENTFARKTVPYFGQFFLPGNRKRICPKNGTAFRANFFCQGTENTFARKTAPYLGKIFLPGHRKHICVIFPAPFCAHSPTEFLFALFSTSQKPHKHAYYALVPAYCRNQLILKYCLLFPIILHIIEVYVLSFMSETINIPGS